MSTAFTKEMFLPFTRSKLDAFTRKILNVSTIQIFTALTRERYRSPQPPRSNIGDPILEDEAFDCVNCPTLKFKEDEVGTNHMEPHHQRCTTCDRTKKWKFWKCTTCRRTWRTTTLRCEDRWEGWKFWRREKKVAVGVEGLTVLPSKHQTTKHESLGGGECEADCYNVEARYCAKIKLVLHRKCGHKPLLRSAECKCCDAFEATFKVEFLRSCYESLR